MPGVRKWKKLFGAGEKVYKIIWCQGEITKNLSSQRVKTIKLNLLCTNNWDSMFLYFRFLSFNNKYLKPLLIRKSNPQPRGWSMFNVCQKLNEKDAKDFVLKSASFSSSQLDFTLAKNNSFARLFSNTSYSYWRRYKIAFFHNFLHDYKFICSEQE